MFLSFAKKGCLDYLFIFKYIWEEEKKKTNFSHLFYAPHPPPPLPLPFQFQLPCPTPSLQEQRTPIYFQEERGKIKSIDFFLMFQGNLIDEDGSDKHVSHVYLGI